MADNGHLRIQKTDIAQVRDLPSYESFHRMYTTALQTEAGAESIEKIGKDARFLAIRDQYFPGAVGGSRIDQESLAKWFLWRWNEYGHDLALHDLKTFMEAGHDRTVMYSLWVTGIFVNERINVGPFELIPLKDMPYSEEKAEFGTFISPFGHDPEPPKAAVCVRRDPAVLDTDEQVNRYKLDLQCLQDFALILNALPGCSCLPHRYTSYGVPEAPPGPFGRASFNSWRHDAQLHGEFSVTRECQDALHRLYEGMNDQPSPRKEKMRRILKRFSQSKARSQLADRILDLGITLEMALLGSQSEQLAMAFRLRGSWLVGDDHQSREDAYKLLNKLYAARSQVAHTGLLYDNKPDKMCLERERLAEYDKLSCRIIQKMLMLTQDPDWDRLLLGAPADNADQRSDNPQQS